MLLGAAETALGADNTALAGKWTYRSFHNNPASVDGDADKVLGLIFAEAVFAFEIPTPTTLKGAIYWDGGGLDLQGTIKPGAPGEHRHRRDRAAMGMSARWSTLEVVGPGVAAAQTGEVGPRSISPGLSERIALPIRLAPKTAKAAPALLSWEPPPSMTGGV